MTTRTEEAQLLKEDQTGFQALTKTDKLQATPGRGGFLGTTTETLQLTALLDADFPPTVIQTKTQRELIQAQADFQVELQEIQKLARGAIDLSTGIQPEPEVLVETQVRDSTRDQRRAVRRRAEV